MDKKIIIELNEIAKNVLFFHQEIATGNYGDDFWSLQITVPPNKLILEYKEKRISCSLHDVIKEMLDKISQ